MRRRKGCALMLAGLLLIASGFSLLLKNIREENAAEAASGEVLGALMQELPTREERREAVQLIITDSKGTEVDWPTDPEGNPVPWPLDADGEPLPTLCDANGETIRWPGGDARSWELNMTGDGFLPWVSDGEGHVMLWPTDARGAMLSIAEVTRQWAERLSALRDTVLSGEAPPLFIANPGMEMPVKRINGYDCIGVLDIPSKELSLPVMQEWSYAKLRVAPCRYNGSVYSGDIIIAGHNYSRHFGTLKGLSIGDEVRFTDADGNAFTYEVSGVETLGKRDVQEMKSGDWDLTLFTCTYGGRSRVTVRCKMTGYECP